MVLQQTKLKEQRGASLIEVVLGGAIFALVITTLVGAYLAGQEATATAGARERASHIADEGVEAARNMRDEDFSALVDGTYGLDASSGEWVFSGTEDVIDIFTRHVEISSIDTDTRQVVSTVTWQQNAQRTGEISVTTYLTNWRRAFAGAPDWTNPAVEAVVDISGTENGTKIQTQGDYAYLVRNSGSPEFSVIDISNTAAPVEVGSTNMAGVPTNIFVSGNYAYISSTANAAELQVIDISTPTAPTVVGTYDAARGADGQGVYYDGTYAYFVRSSSNRDEFWVIDVSTPASPSLVGSLNLSARGNEVVVIGSYAYIASQSNTQELQVVDISTPASPSIVGSYNLGGGDNSLSITGFGNTIVHGRVGGEVTLFDVSTPTAPTIVGTYSAVNNVNDVALGNSNQYVFIATNDDPADFKLIDISTPSTPSEISTLGVTGTLNGISYNAGSDRAIAAGTDNSSEVIIIMPQ